MPLTTATAIALAQPFPAELVELKPGATNGDKTQALALAYVDARHYQSRLDAVVGFENWSVTYRPWGDRAVICALTICGVTREDVGEAEQGDPNQATSGAMQAFKRACAAFGLGRYLYTDLPQMWVPAEQRGKNTVIKDQHQAVQQMYAKAGIDLSTRIRYQNAIMTMLGAMDEQQLVAVGKGAKNVINKADFDAIEAAQVAKN